MLNILMNCLMNNGSGGNSQESSGNGFLDMGLLAVFIGLLNYEKNLEQIERGKHIETMLKEVLSKLENSELRSD